MTNSISHESHHEAHQEEVYSKTILGFWIYLLTDFMLFGTLFATYIVLESGTYGGPSGRALWNLPFTLIQTLILLTSSFTSGLGGALAHRNCKNGTLALFAITFFLGAVFMGMEFAEFSRLVQGGNSWERSAFLSAFFTLVGTHGLHLLLGLLWIFVLLVPVWRCGLTPVSVKRLTCLRMFWQFLNVVWIFIFTIVYLMGVK